MGQSVENQERFKASAKALEESGVIPLALKIKAKRPEVNVRIADENPDTDGYGVLYASVSVLLPPSPKHHISAENIIYALPTGELRFRHYEHNSLNSTGVWVDPQKEGITKEDFLTKKA